jgi:membrane fusion protein, multidrug efflux system
VQRIPVKIVIDSGLDPDLPLPLGMSAVPTVRLTPSAQADAASR